MCANHASSEPLAQSAVEDGQTKRPGVAASLLLALIHGYRLVLGPWLGGRCRFHPSCSEYGLLAIRKYGAWRGGWLTAWRILRCQPLSQGGIDYP